jgi:hypothetical protein
MKQLYKNLKLHQLILFVVANLLLVSCGTYQSAYNNDGIYNDENGKNEEQKVIVVDEKEYNDYEKNYFTKKLEVLESIDGNEIFTDVDSYNSNNIYIEDEVLDEALNYNTNQPWGYEENDIVVQINLINNPYWSRFNNWGWGFNDLWGYRRGFRNWGFNDIWNPFYGGMAWNIGFLYNPYVYNPYYFNRPWNNNSYYRNHTYGRRLTNNSYARRNSTANSRYSKYSNRRQSSNSSKYSKRIKNTSKPTRRNTSVSRNSSTYKRKAKPTSKKYNRSNTIRRRNNPSNFSNNGSSARRSSSSNGRSSSNNSRSSSSKKRSSSKRRGN